MKSFSTKLLKAIKHPIQTLRTNFFTGLLVITPLVVAGWLAVIGFDIFRNSYHLVPRGLRPPEDMVFWFQAIIYAGFLCLGVFLVSLLGWASKQYIGKRILAFLRDLLHRIPILGTIYSAIDQLFETFGTSGKEQFRRVVYVEYPRREMWTVAFVTGESRSRALSPGHINLFVPTVPNPTSGYLLIVKEDQVIESNMTVEEAFKVILSLGIADGRAPRNG